MILPGLGIRIPPKIPAEVFAHKMGLKLVPLADAWKIRQCSFAPGVSSFQFRLDYHLADVDHSILST